VWESIPEDQNKALRISQLSLKQEQKGSRIEELEEAVPGQYSVLSLAIMGGGVLRIEGGNLVATRLSN
jgi:Tfp pilus assembly protein PilN